MVALTSGIAPPAILQGQTILSADDEPLICLDVEDILREAGAEVITTHDLDHASRAIHTKPLSAAVLDIHLGPDPIDPLCDDLKIRGVPFVFSTGDPEAVPHRWGPVPVLTRPFARSDLIGALITALVGTSALQQPFESLAPIHEHLFQAQCRALRQRLLVQQLKTSGVDTAAAEELLRLIQDAAELFRESAKTFSATWMPSPKTPSDRKT
jgi:DNA-binding response OmpR family regulator